MRTARRPRPFAALGWLDQRRLAVHMAVRQAWRDDILKLSSSLAYTLIFAIFPALIFLAALLEVLGIFKDATREALDWVSRQPGDSPWHVLDQPLASALRGSAPVIPLLVFGGALTLWTASNYIGSYVWAISVIRGVRGERPFWLQRLLQLAPAMVAFLVIVAAVIIAVVSGPIATRVGKALDAGHTVGLLWTWGRWPLLFVVLSVLFAVFFQIAPGARRRRLGLFTTGSVVAIVGWLVVTVGFSVYVRYFANYNRVYGTLGASIAFLVWLWLFNVALLVATEIDVALERVRAGDVEAEEDGSAGKKASED